jgi:plastocyanin
MKIMNRMTFSQSLHWIGIPLLSLLTWTFGWPSTLPADVDVTMDYWTPYYRPALAIVPDGVSIHIVNPTSSPHSVTHDGCRLSRPCAFDTGAVQPGQDFTIPSLPPGRYSYYCLLHPIMKGDILVIPKDTMLSQAATQDTRVNTHATIDE